MRVLLLSVWLITSSWSFSQTKNFLDKPYLETIAKVDSLVKPDRIYLSIFISEKEDRNKTSVETQEQQMAHVLKNLGIDLSKQLKLEDLMSNYKNYFLRKKSVLKSKSFELIVYDGLTASKVLLGLESVGISNINVKKTAYSKAEVLKLRLKTLAIQKAKRQAEALVEPLNQTLGKALYINDKYYANYQGYGASNSKIHLAYESSRLASDTPIDVEFSGIKVESEVIVKFAID